MGDAEAYDRILAILLLAGQEKMLPVFMSKEIKMNNGHLPLKKESPLLNLVQDWRYADQLSFRREQWKVLAPVFGPETISKEERHYKFLYHEPLPFKRMDKQPMEGSFGFVEAVTIHEAHNRFTEHTVSSTRPQLIPYGLEQAREALVLADLDTMDLGVRRKMAQIGHQG